jgi:hypothetical protein
METTSKPARQQRSEAEIKTFLSEHEQSDLTVKEFCELYDISEQTFYNWRNKYQPKTEKGEVFVPLQLAEPTSELFAEIDVPGKMIIRLYRQMDASFFKSLMQ